MRVTSKVTADNALFYIQQARAKLDKLNEQFEKKNWPESRWHS